MGVIWITTSGGKKIHLPVVGENVNTPNSLIAIPASMIINQGWCYSNPITLSHPIYGIFTIDFNVNGRTGSCNQCGQCCSHPIASCPNPGNCGYITDGNFHRCSHLMVKGQEIGKKNGTSCNIYQSLIENNLKGCMCYPEKLEEITPWISTCGFKFS